MSAVGSSSPVKLGIVGCGNISSIYLDNLTATPAVQVAACADIVPERAKARAAEFGIPRACDVDELLSSDEVELVVNLTVPAAHHEVALAAIEGGLAVYNEKPLAVELAAAEQVLAEGRLAGVRVGCAPDTFLGPGLQECRRIIDAGVIGTPIAATATMLSRGHESWHPDPDFYYQRGGGPMFDMGPYYLSALVSLLGPVRRVTGSARASFAHRRITSAPRSGETIGVDVPTHIAGVLDFDSGAIATVVTSFDVWKLEDIIEIHGSEASLCVPSPNGFGGPVRIRRAGGHEWEDLPLGEDYRGNARGLGVIDMAVAMRCARPHRASAELALHVLEIMHAVHEAASEGRHVELSTTCTRPEPLGETERWWRDWPASRG